MGLTFINHFFLSILRKVLATKKNVKKNPKRIKSNFLCRCPSANILTIEESGKELKTANPVFNNAQYSQQVGHQKKSEDVKWKI